MTASRVGVELIHSSYLFGLSQGLRLEDGTYSSTLHRINKVFLGAGRTHKTNYET